MSKENLADYRFNREEMRDMKSCITSYMGFTFGGAGLLMGVLVFINKSSENSIERILRVYRTQFAVCLLLFLWYCLFYFTE